MATSSVFPQSINYNGTVWHLAYDPSCELTVQPSISEHDVQRITCDPVRFAGREQPVYMLVAHILIPSSRDSSGNIIGARRMMGFRTFDYQPAPSYKVKPNELVYYVAEQTGGVTAQDFFDAITGGAIAMREAEKPDVSWCKQFGAESDENS